MHCTSHSEYNAYRRNTIIFGKRFLILGNFLKIRRETPRGEVAMLDYADWLALSPSRQILYQPDISDFFASPEKIFSKYLTNKQHCDIIHIKQIGNIYI